ncbi:hypothetical protein GQ600_11739 [Phytophthora cactorum]|nr:hypothetical protein GQ600_11739 [Phytophthora cactorum]
MSEQISNTIESNSEIENGAEAVATTEVAYEQVKRDTKSSTGSPRSPSTPEICKHQYKHRYSEQAGASEPRR